MKKIFYALLIVGALLSLKFTLDRSVKQPLKSTKTPTGPTTGRIATEVRKMREFLSRNPKYNSDVVFLADMKIMSGKNRFFVYDLRKDSLTDRGLVMHGYGSATQEYGKLTFSNKSNSLCTSLGKYAIGNSYEGTFGKAYKLYGLDKTNDNAFARNVVLHKYDPMPDAEQPGPIACSYGCPTVSPVYFKRLEKIIDDSEKSILLDIYY